jgi:predicted amidohydrolase YtcJ
MKTVFFILFFSCLSSCMKTESADLVVFNAEINTMNENGDVAQAMAIRDGKVIEFGPDRQILNKYSYSNSIDARGKQIYPGFIDAHGHMISYAALLLGVDLVGSPSEIEMLERVSSYKNEHNKAVIIGMGWDQSLWKDDAFPDNGKLNEMFPKTPVCLYRIDGHSALVNNSFIGLLGDFEVPNGGAVLQDEFGNYTGLFVDAALQLFEGVLPKYTNDEMKPKLLEIQEELLAHGVTGVHEAGVDADELSLLDEMVSSNALKLNIYAMLAPSEENKNFVRKNGVYRNKSLLVRSFKAYVDGALGSSGALLKEPYHEHPNYNGLSLSSVSELNRLRDFCLSNGYQLNCHGIGDAAVSQILEMCKKAYDKNPDHRFRLEHAQVVDPKDLKLFNTYAVFPSVQPTHATTDQRWAASKLGAERMKGAYAYKSLLNQFGMIALGTDFPIEYTNPYYTIHSAVHRKNAKGFPKKGFLAEESLSIKETLKGMTIWGAFASFQEKELGSLEQGKHATFFILDRPLNKSSTFSPNYSWKTFVKGEIVHSLD